MRNLTALIFLLFSIKSFSQTVAPFVVSTTGNAIQNSQYSLEYSVGELAIATIGNANNMVTEGLLQPQVNLVTAVAFTSAPADLRYTNDKEILQIFTSLPGKLIDISDMLGQQVYQGKCLPVTDISMLSPGVYLVKISDEQLWPFKTFKIAK